MSVGRAAARGAAWTIALGLCARVVGLCGTLTMTHLVAPDVLGAAGVAMVVAMAFHWVTSWGIGQYVIVRGRDDAAAEVAWHAAVAQLVLGGASTAAAALLGPAVAPWFGGPAAAALVPGLAVALWLRRLASLPEKALARRLRFGAVAASLVVGEAAYAGVAVATAWAGAGAWAVVWGNLAQGGAMLALLAAAAGARAWLAPTRLAWARVRDMVRFGLPLGVESAAHNAARYGDNLVVARLFGPGAMAFYNMAYNLADLPATYVGEQVGGVLLPSLAALPPARRAAALERAVALLGLVVTPMAVGLGVVAPTLIEAALGPAWQAMAPLLTVLAGMAVFRPVSWALGAYLESHAQTRRLMLLEVGKLAALLAGLVALRSGGLTLAACAVPAAYGLAAGTGVVIAARAATPAPSVRRLLAGYARPLAACAVMVAAVLGARQAAGGATAPAARLALEVGVGVVAYVAAALVLAPAAARDLRSQLAHLRRRR